MFQAFESAMSRRLSMRWENWGLLCRLAKLSSELTETSRGMLEGCSPAVVVCPAAGYGGTEFSLVVDPNRDL